MDEASSEKKYHQSKDDFFNSVRTTLEQHRNDDSVSVLFLIALHQDENGEASGISCAHNLENFEKAAHCLNTISVRLYMNATDGTLDSNEETSH